MDEIDLKEDIRLLSDNVKQCLSIDALLRDSDSMKKHVKDLLKWVIGRARG